MIMIARCMLSSFLLLTLLLNIPLEEENNKATMCKKIDNHNSQMNIPANAAVAAAMVKVKRSTENN